MKAAGKGSALGLSLGLAVFAPVAAADGLDVFKYALSGGTPNVDVRLRYEGVDQNNALSNADAGTLRARLGYTTGKWNALDLQLEFEGTEVLGDAKYDNNPAPTLGTPGYSVIADPRGNELNQAWIRYAGIPKTTLKLGRQRLILDNARFVGNVGWRQNEATFDSYLGTTALIPKTTVNYAYLVNVNNITFQDLRLHGHLVNVNVAALDALSVVAYGYLLDWDLSATSPPLAPATLAPPQREDTQTLGLRLSGSVPVGKPKLGYAAEYAEQQDYGDSTINDSEYWLAELSFGIPEITGKVSYEVLGGDGTNSFQTPLATLHIFQGWADQFLTTPRAGIKDVNATLSSTIAKVAMLARWHQYEADSGGMDFGDELNLQVTYPINDQFSAGAKYADFNARTTPPFVDTKKTWAWLEYKF